MDAKSRKELSEVLRDIDQINSLTVKALLSQEEKDILMRELKTYIADVLAPAKKEIKKPEEPDKKDEPKQSGSSRKSDK